MTNACELRTETRPAAVEADQAATNERRLMEVYRDRARQLAARPAAVAVASWPALAFSLASERICLPLAELVEVLPYGRCARLPGSPGELLGVINVRGRICSVIDLARIVGVAVPDDRSGGFILLVRHGASEVGLRVDQADRIEPSVTTDSTDGGGTPVFSPQYFKGWTTKRVPILDVRAVLSHQVFQSRNSAGATRP